MKRRIIIYISIFVFLSTVILSNIKEIQNKEYTNVEMQQFKGQLEADESTDLFVYLPTDW